MSVIRRGSRGDAVVQLQNMLGLVADGIFGPVTEKAVRLFQQTRGLVVDGIVGPATWAALRSIPSSPQPTSSTPGVSRVFTHGTARIIETDPDNIEIREIRNTLRGANVNGITAGFFWPMSPVNAQNANGVIVNGNTIIGDQAAHNWRGFGQWVLCYYRDKSFGVEFVRTANELSKPVIWAFGGVSLLPNFDPGKEGFSGSYADVMRHVTAQQGGHCMVGVKDGKVLLYWRTNCTRNQTRQDAITLGWDYAIGCDGGGSAQIRHPQLQDAHTVRRINTAFVLKRI